MVLEVIKNKILRKRETTLTTTDVLFKTTSPGFIRPTDHVLVVGPGIQIHTSGVPFIPMDRSLIVLPPYMANKGGRVTVLDAPSGIPGFGDHDIQEVKYWFEHISKIIPLCPIEYIEGILLRDTFNLPNQFDCIIDHLTTFGWLLMNRSDISSVTKISKQVIDTYSSFLKPMGKIIMHYFTSQFDGISDTVSQRKLLLKMAMVENNFDVSDIYPISDTYQIPKVLQREFLKQGYSRGFDLDIHHRFKSYYISEGILIGQKL